jgi:hypothetical protein
MKKLTLLIGVGVGYVLGTRAGRERYEQIRGGVKKLASNPTVQSAAGKAQDTVTTQASAAASAVSDKVSDKVGEKLGGSGGSSGTSATTPGTSGTTGASGPLGADGQPLTRS